VCMFINTTRMFRDLIFHLEW